MVMRSKDRSRCLDSIDHYIDLWQDEPFEQILVELSGVGDPEAGRAGCRRFGCLTGFLDTRKEYFRNCTKGEDLAETWPCWPAFHFISSKKHHQRRKEHVKLLGFTLSPGHPSKLGPGYRVPAASSPSHTPGKGAYLGGCASDKAFLIGLFCVFLLISVSGQRRQVLSHEIGRTLERHWDLNRLRYLGGKLRGW